MKNYTYVVCSALMFMLPQLNAQLVSAEDALCRLQELQEVIEHGDQDIDQVLFEKELFALQTFVTESAVCDEHTRDALLHALQVLQEKISLRRAARIDSPEIHATTVIDPNYYPERDLYLRNLLVTGSLVLNGQQISGNSCDCTLYVLKAGDTMTGDLTFADQHGVVFNDTASGSVTITAPAVVTTPYTLELPTQPGAAGTVLTADGNNPSQLSWQPVAAIVTSTIQLYGDVIGSASANHVAFVCGVPACDLVRAYSTVLSATSCDTPLTLILRDTTGSFAATTITLTGNSLINYSASGDCDTGQGFIFAPTNLNTIIGLGAGNSNTLTGSANTAVGQVALYSNTTGDLNTALGLGALYNNTQGSLNTAIGAGVLFNNMIGMGNTAVGQSALFSNTLGFNNTAIGNGALGQNTTGTSNIALGAFAGNSIITGNNNIHIGNPGDVSDDATIRIGTQNTQQQTYIAGIFDTFLTGSPVVVTSSGQLGVGTSALVSGTPCNTPLTVVERDANGSFAATTLTLTGNSLLNYSTMGDCDIGDGFVFAPTNQNTLIGLGAGNNNTLTGTSNVAIGYSALMSITAGSSNIAIGSYAGAALEGSEFSPFAGSLNIAIGNNTLRSLRLGLGNVAIGDSALARAADNPIPVSLNTAIGVGALTNSVASGLDDFGFITNVAVGGVALSSNITGENNAAVGTRSLVSNVEGNRNTSIGINSLVTLTGGSNNTAVGYTADVDSESAQNRTALGANSLAIVDDGVVCGDTSITYIYPGSDKRAQLGYAPSNIFDAVNAVQYRSYDAANNYAALTPPLGYSYTYTLQLPIDQGSAGQVLATDGNNPAQLYWADSSSTATAGTPCNTPLTVVERDASGSFAATTMTFTGNSLINYSTVGGCDTGDGFVFAPTNFNTIIGLGAGNNNTLTGTGNVALGFTALAGIVTSNNNIAIGSNVLTGTLILDDNIALGTNALSNVNYARGQQIAIGSGALQKDTTGFYNLAIGYNALNNNTSGNSNIAIGHSALIDVNNTDNIAIGNFALSGLVQNKNIAIGNYAQSFPLNTGFSNIAIGAQALHYNRTGNQNIAIGTDALQANQTGYYNIGIGHFALFLNNDGYQNTCVGYQALSNNLILGSNNTALGYYAGWLCGGSNNIYIGANVTGGLNNNNVIAIGINNSGNSGTYIGGIRGATTNANDAIAVLVDSSGQLGTTSSSARYKRNIQDMGTATADIYKLRPVIFNYKAHETDEHLEYGLIAEEVEKVYPGIVVKDKNGLPEAIQYQYLPMMMLNEMQKNYAQLLMHEETINTLKTQIAELKQQITALVG
ncbi:MAG: tail fiber domain-containing protein [Candidatus Babeliaceae bacterium]|nr:tail fiber domain-containing protein [Candidatus Babeliaceae bacterium]